MFLRQNIRILRMRKAMTQESLAEAIGIKRSLLQAYEAGRAEPSLKTVEKVSNYFNVPIDDLIKKELKILIY